MGHTSGDLKQPFVNPNPPPYIPLSEPKEKHIPEPETNITGPPVTDADLVPEDIAFDTMQDGLEGQNSGYFTEAAQGSIDNPAEGLNLTTAIPTDIKKLLPFAAILGLFYIGVSKILLFAVAGGILYYWTQSEKSTVKEPSPFIPSKQLPGILA